MTTPHNNLKNQGMNTARIEAFSDAVIAIVITLLILEIKIPEIHEHGLIATELPQKLLALWPKILSYATSFLVIGIYWVAHHNAFHYIKRSDRILLWINMLFLMCLSFLPFPTALIGEYGKEPTAVAFYGFCMLITAAVFTGMWWYMAYGGNLLRQDVEPQIIRMITISGFLGLPLYIFAIIFAFISIPISIAIYILMPIFYIILNVKWSKG